MVLKTEGEIELMDEANRIVHSVLDMICRAELLRESPPERAGSRGGRA